MSVVCTSGNSGVVLGLDLDDCLVRSEHNALTTAYGYYVESVAPKLGLPPPGNLERFISEHPGMTFKGIVSENCRRHGVAISEEQLKAFAAEEKNRIIANFERNGLDVTPGTREALQFMSEAGIPYSIVTSSAYDRALVSIRAARLQEFFSADADNVFSAQGHTYKGEPKPDPGIYQYAFGHYPAESVFIALEDSKSGATAAFRVGAFVIGNVGALPTTAVQVDRMKLLLDVGASIVLNNNESLVGLLGHLREYADSFTREGVETYLREGAFLPEFVEREAREGRVVWVNRRIY